MGTGRTLSCLCPVTTDSDGTEGATLIRTLSRVAGLQPVEGAPELKETAGFLFMQIQHLGESVTMGTGL